ncbi:malto-oligosyltrehalose synthase [[Pseudomonas] carboxydohydrogena]|uniref:Malto-oligosyltrehalose synthase n=1 Tax=Afipia carboxydohydrogena TaxID=290 RepID=A0ABY8BPQ5_AFICR|nr:malto-oligosyltrehalose synthase [[Pseudomonas] carboxydohydrogena]WEF50909.1 malto-oligosyltrehalose synthase [[Pseudomonas] carboxydohydrogena]
MPSAIPRATYRLQLNENFTFDDAAAVAPYLKALGISHVYASPFLKARAHSQHGYDIVDHNSLNPELGGDAAFERFSAALKRNDLGLILDFVPNHMGVHFADNPWWLDVLEWGPASPYADFFDIDWDLLPYRAKGGVLLPILGNSYGEALDKGEIELRYDAGSGSFAAWYYEHRLPIAPERYSEILRIIASAAGAGNEPAGRAILELAARYTGLRHPDRGEAPAFKAALREIDGAEAIITRGLEAYRAGAGREAQTKALHSLLERQHYRLGHWRLATSEINYRRFFDINTLAGLRVENVRAFKAAHALIRRLVAAGQLQGIRLDHIDGLHDPAQYCRRLLRLIRDAQETRAPFYLVMEKIVGEGERLPEFPGMHGTTGYESLNLISRVLLDGKGLETLDETWRQASNVAPDFAPVLRAAKQRVMETLLASEFTVLGRLLARIAGGHYTTRDFSADSLRQALELYVLHFPVYRTYITAAGPSSNDRALIAETIGKAKADWFGADEGVFDFLQDALTLELATKDRATHGRERVRRFALKVQQFTGPMMAKSLEDTAFYRYHRLLALNEVGGDAAATSLPVKDFHDAMQARARDFPHGMTATATHDTKRGEDARARLLALPELAGEWASLVGRWKSFNAPHIVTEGNMRSPSLAFEYMLYQALIGAWPETIDADFLARMKAYAIKAAREAKVETSWLNPQPSYERGVETFLERTLDEKKSPEFLSSIETFTRRISTIGILNSLSQLTLKAMMPGVPDFYQGTEFWDYSLVDPDNRRPVDFKAREAELADISKQPRWDDLITRASDGRIKLAWTHHLLTLRKTHPDLFANGNYLPLEVTGPHRDHVIAFARVHRREAVIVAAMRWFSPFTDGGRTWLNGAIEGAVRIEGLHAGAPSRTELPFAELFAELPVATREAAVRRAYKKAARGPGRAA